MSQGSFFFRLVLACGAAASVSFCLSYVILVLGQWRIPFPIIVSAAYLVGAFIYVRGPWQVNYPRLKFIVMLFAVWMAAWEPTIHILKTLPR